MISVRRFSRPDDVALWDQFVDSQARNATFLHRRSYMDYHAERYADLSLMIYDDSRLVALMPGCVVGCRFVSHAGLTYGGLLVGSPMTQSLVIDAFKAINALLTERGLTEVVYRPTPYIYYNQPAQEDLYAIFNELSGRLEARAVSSAIDLQSAPIPLSENRRRGVKKARKAGLAVSTSADYSAFWQILSDNLRLRHNTAPVHTLAEIQQLAGANPEIKLYVVKDSVGVTLAGCVIFECGQTAHVQYISANEQGREFGALDLLFAELIKLYQSDFHYLDFGVSTEQAGTMLNRGLIHQKEGFGARAVVYDTYSWTL